MDKKLKDIMVSLPVSIEASSSLRESLRLMKSKAVSHLIVTDSEKKLKGIISKQDVLDSLFQLIARTTGKTYTALELDNMTIAELMTKNPYSLGADDDAAQAAELLVKHNINCLPIIDSTNNIIGVVTSYDILKHLTNK